MKKKPSENEMVRATPIMQPPISHFSTPRRLRDLVNLTVSIELAELLVTLIEESNLDLVNARQNTAWEFAQAIKEVLP